jgi:hypothetical protein
MHRKNLSKTCERSSEVQGDSLGSVSKTAFPTFALFGRRARHAIVWLWWYPFRDSRFAILALLAQTAIHILWAGSAKFSETHPVWNRVFNTYNVDVVGLPIVIGVSLTVFRLRVESIRRDTWAFIVGALVGEQLGFVAVRPIGTGLDFTMHCAFAALHLAVCIPIVFTMICLKKWTQRDSDERGSGRSAT